MLAGSRQENMKERNLDVRECGLDVSGSEVGCCECGMNLQFS